MIWNSVWISFFYSSDCFCSDNHALEVVKFWHIVCGLQLFCIIFTWFIEELRLRSFLIVITSCIYCVIDLMSIYPFHFSFKVFFFKKKNPRTVTIFNMNKMHLSCDIYNIFAIVSLTFKLIILDQTCLLHPKYLPRPAQKLASPGIYNIPCKFAVNIKLISISSSSSSQLSF